VVLADLGRPGDAVSGTGERWPRWVYGEGEEPDHRFSLANERTFLAWVRTSLALLAAGVGLDAVDLDGSRSLQTALAVALLLLGLGSVVAAWGRWARSERAVRLDRPLPSTTVLAWLALALLLVAAGLVLVVL
jgi:putative membrane protein